MYKPQINSKSYAFTAYLFQHNTVYTVSKLQIFEKEKELGCKGTSLVISSMTVTLFTFNINIHIAR